MGAAYHVILASTSPRRRELLKVLGIRFSAIAPGFAGESEEVDETPLLNEAPAALVQRLSRLKAQAVVDHLPQLLLTLDLNQMNRVIIIAADTVVALDGKILGKPQDPAEATAMLTHLRQRAHDVYSGLTVAYFPPSSTAITFITRLQYSQVWMRPYTEAEITAYVASGSPLDKAGAYGIQDNPFNPVERWQGCFASVMGLPLAELAQILAEIGIPLPAIAPICSRHIGMSCCQGSSPVC
jgi:MAF protein